MCVTYVMCVTVCVSPCVMTTVMTIHELFLRAVAAADLVHSPRPFEPASLYIENADIILSHLSPLHRRPLDTGNMYTVEHN